MKPETLDRYLGCLLGLAIGDALGAAVEFEPPGTFEPVTGYRAGGPHRLAPGEWTDDTSMALCLAQSLLDGNGFDPGGQMRLYLRWWWEGYLSVNGRFVDIGNTTRDALTRFSRTGEPFSGSTEHNTAGNGSLMRLAPVPMAFAARPEEAIRLSGESSRTTHGAIEAVDACRFFAGLLIGALTGVDKDQLLTPTYSPVPGLWEREPLCPSIASVAAGSYRSMEPPAIRGTGHVVRSLEATLWAVQKGSAFENSVLLAINLGEDADTTGAICGQLAGALYGAEAIPAALKSGLAQESILSAFAERLYHFGSSL